MIYNIFYDNRISDDLKKIPSPTKKRLRTAIENKLATNPEKFGEPLRKNLRGFWKLRVGDYRIVFKVDNDEAVITIIAIIHRKEVYEVVGRRA